MKLLERIRPVFWGQEAGTGPYRSLFNYTRIWQLIVLLLAGVSLIPLLIFTFIDYNLTRRAVVQEATLRTTRVTSNTRRTLTYFLDERRAALEFLVREEAYSSLSRPQRLPQVLLNLKQGFGGFVDLGIIDSSGRQVAYTGPFDLQGRNYTDQDWFQKTLERGSYISDVFKGYRDIPHMIIAVKHKLAHGDFFVLRATLDTEPINTLISTLDLPRGGDAFLMNDHGVLQTPSRGRGDILQETNMPIPAYSESTQVMNVQVTGEDLLVGYAYIQDTPFILMILKPSAVLLKPWYETRTDLVWLLAVSVSVILVVVIGVATYMVNKAFIADQTRTWTLHQVEHTSRMASIGRLAAGVAHEINNPLAIINEKAGLIQDLVTYSDKYQDDERLRKIVEDVISNVERCGVITHRLLGFARHVEVNVEEVDLRKIINEVLSFLNKEAEYREIEINVDTGDDLPRFESDRGKLQQIFLNLVNNSFQAMKNGGHLHIFIHKADPGWIEVRVKDNGCGIPQGDLKRIFEPFFSTKKRTGGTGLGLSITYGLVRELGGDVDVHSEVGRGTEFVISLPYDKKQADKGEASEDSAG
jgi:signal transduction histidine kinase/uncharacterized membrane protein